MELPSSDFPDAEITGIRFSLASYHEIRAASISDCGISHGSQLSNPFLGLPLEFGRCESCGTSDPDKCEGHFGYIELPIPIYHPSHISELKKVLSFLCLKCLKMRKSKPSTKNTGIGELLLTSCCADAAQVSIREVKTTDGANYLQLKVPKGRYHPGFWNFLDKFGYRYGDCATRTLLPCEVVEMFKRLPGDTERKLVAKGYFPQEGFIIQYLPVPPNCLSVPDISDGVTIMSSDLSTTLLRKVVKEVEIIRSSRSGNPNFQSHEVEANELQIAVNQYLQFRGTGKAARDVDTRFGFTKEPATSATKAWLEKMKNLFIRKGSGFSSRSVITGDSFKKVNEVGIPFEVAQKITLEETVSIHNMRHLQHLVDNKLCLTYRDGSTSYSLREGSKGHTSLRPGQVVHRRIMDGDIVFINRPPTTHKHSLQALSVYIHEDHTVKVNPLICGPLGADFDGDCIHLFYPQSLGAKAEVLELFSVDKQLLSSHNGNLNLQLGTDSLLSLKMMFRIYFFGKLVAQQTAMFLPSCLPQPALLRANRVGATWTTMQILETILPSGFDCRGDRYLIRKSSIVDIDYSKDFVASMINEIVTSILFEKSPQEVLKFFDALQPLLMENLFTHGFSVSLKDFYLPQATIQDMQKSLKVITPGILISTHNELVKLQLENYLRLARMPVAHFILRSSALGDLVDSKSDSSVSKVVQQVGFLGIQLSERGKFYSKSLFDDMAFFFRWKHPRAVHYPCGEFGFIRSSFISGLDPYEAMVHSISSREVIVRSSRGLSEPGTLFKNLMAILRDVVICYDGTVRNVCNQSILQFEYGSEAGSKTENLFPAGEPVGVLAATAMSNPAYKAVLDSSPSSNSSWDLMKEILLCRVKFQNESIDRRVNLYLNHCGCGRLHCREAAANVVKTRLKKISLKDAAVRFMIVYKELRAVKEGSETHTGLIGHIHLNQAILKELNVSILDILQKCQETINLYRKRKKLSRFFKGVVLSVSDDCICQPLSSGKSFTVPCLTFSSPDISDEHLERIRYVHANIICPVLLETIIKGDPRILSANIIWVNPGTANWLRNSHRSQNGEVALDIVVEKSACKQSGDAWRVVLDSCLPVFHLIDVRRSMPYAIKQVQEFLGISCAFDQAVHRLSSSVATVAKGVLKEHLILLGNSMSCSGNLIGFNSGGYKALCRSLNVQIPFTEATLFTPRKCFERASANCHVDTLSSIVASCSWGKRVTVGTGSKFDLLWANEKVDWKQETGSDIYSFLHMVRDPNIKNRETACLGVEVDHLNWDYENADGSLSPENLSEKPTFEEIFDHQLSKSNWDDVPSVNNGATDNVWESRKTGNLDANGTKNDSWSSWHNKDPAQDHSSNIQENSDRANGCDIDDAKTNWDRVTTVTKGDSWSSWNNKDPVPDMSTKIQEYSERTNCWDSGDGKSTSDSDTKWNNVKNSSNWEPVNDVDTNKVEENSWGPGKRPEPVKSPTCASNGAKTIWNNVSPANNGLNVDNVASPHNEGASVDDGSNWEKPGSVNCVSDDNAWGSIRSSTKHRDVSDKGWNSSQGKVWNGCQEKFWNSSHNNSASVDDGQNWQKPGSVNCESNDNAGGSIKNTMEHRDVSDKGWSSSQDKAWNSSQDKGWNSSRNECASVDDGQAWNSSQDKGWNSSRNDCASVDDGSNWEKRGSVNCEPNDNAWGSISDTAEHRDVSDKGWNGSQNESDKRFDSNQWGGESRKKRKFDGSDRWSLNPDSKAKKTRGRNPGEDTHGPRLLTATRQRLDMFTSEEQDILSDVEPTMQSTKKILREAGDKDKDPLPEDEQKFIQEKVFNYHPDKEAKIGAGIAHFMVTTHKNFSGSRCFYVVSTDGREEDFSYLKCLENYVRTKYPDQAELFNSKYFVRPRDGGRERSVAPEEAAADNR